MKRAAAIARPGPAGLFAGVRRPFRCGTKLVTEGDTRSEVAAKCGEPTEVITLRSVFRRPVIWDHGRPVLRRRGLHRSAGRELDLQPRA